MQPRIEPNGNLTLVADYEDKANIKDIMKEHGESLLAEYEALEYFLCNSEYSWIDPCEIGALTAAPIIGTRDQEGNVIDAWGYMDYQIRSFIQDFLEKGEATFIKG
jgi:hypothetical protein